MSSAQYLELAELAGGFIHELKNHINGLSLNLQLLGEDLDPPQTPRERRAAERVARLTDDCRRLVDLSNDFLRFARVDTPNVVRCDLAELVNRMADFLSPTARIQNVEVVCHAAPDLPAVHLDADLFEKALLNLMLNAQDAMPEGGVLTVQVRPDGHAVTVAVIDTGVGVPADLLPKLFRPFFTTKPGGHGLGLAIARRIVQAHGGEITCHSEPGCGTQFVVRVPTLEPDTQ
ncbi:MAG: ATP-binding protein [Fimbriiglobus sp.]|jgi:signal transduction histidine kinase|nr:ATP-binding protein [Fimbriiglobus sp.]